MCVSSAAASPFSEVLRLSGSHDTGDEDLGVCCVEVIRGQQQSRPKPTMCLCSVQDMTNGQRLPTFLSSSTQLNDGVGLINLQLVGSQTLSGEQRRSTCVTHASLLACLWRNRIDSTEQVDQLHARRW